MRPVFHKALTPEIAAKALAACPGAQVGGIPGTRASSPYQASGEVAVRARTGWTPSTGLEAFVGKVVSIQKGYASDPETRFKAAAAGGLTTLASHLIDSKQVDFVVHVKACALYSDVSTQGSKLSFSSAEVFEGKGSRYGPLNRPFAVVAKPCDINAVRNMAKEFRWRGHGCPGDCPYVRTSDGREAAYDYVDFWFENGKESGPLTYQWRCKMCSDFIGYQADVVVMDCWPKGAPERRKEITDARKHEWDGWVLVIARSERGQAVVDSAKDAGVLTLGPAEGREVLETQPLGCQVFRMFDVRCQ
eukprot:g27640.t1